MASLPPYKRKMDWFLLENGGKLTLKLWNVIPMEIFRLLDSLPDCWSGFELHIWPYTLTGFHGHILGVLVGARATNHGLAMLIDWLPSPNFCKSMIGEIVLDAIN